MKTSDTASRALSVCFAGGLPGKNTEVPSKKKQSYEEWLAERSRPGHITEVPRTHAAIPREPDQPQNGVSAGPKPSTDQKDLPSGIPSARNSDGLTFEEWLAERAKSAPTHVVGVSEGGGLETFSQDLSHNGDDNVRTSAQTTQAPDVNGFSHAPSERDTEAAKRTEARHGPAVNGNDHSFTRSQAAMANHSAGPDSDRDQDAMLQSMLFEGSPSGQPSPLQNGFRSAGKPPPASSRDQAHAPAAPYAESGSKPSKPGVEGAVPDAPTLKHQQFLEAAIRKMQQDHKEQVLNS